MDAIHTIAGGLHAELLPPRDAPYRLQAVWELVELGCRAEIVLQWTDSYLRFRADPDTDSIGAEFGDTEFVPGAAYRNISAVAPWHQWVGMECGWTWIAVNQQGYGDSVLLSFAGIVPTVLLHVMASSIKVLTVTSA